MKLLELSREKLTEVNKQLYSIIKKEYNYDLVIFIAKGSYLIGSDLARFNDVGLLEIFATRKGGKIKKILAPCLKLIPSSIKAVLRKTEFNSNYHEKNNDRKIMYDERVWNRYKGSKNILLVDDSVDTGYSIKFAKEAISNYFKDSNVKVAAINYFTKSEKIQKIDFYVYKETLLLGPWSNDSRENREYLKDYYKWHGSQV